MIAVSRELVDRSVRELRRCGEGRRECVVFWLATLDRPDRVIEVIHPSHSSSPFGYEVDSRWLTEFMFSLADEERMAVGQLHSHPGTLVEHSATDDEFVLIPTPGFISIVVPHFGDTIDPRYWGIHVLEPSGEWRLDSSVVAW